jgi:hypothetical protein
MQILVHLGLNKCASTYIQQALAATQAGLRQQGVFYAVEGGRTAQYGLSRHYGFGPDVDGVTPRNLAWLMAEASRRHCTRLIVSSEYLSLCRPAAIAAFTADLDALGAEARFLIFSRETGPWLRSLFNQYVKTVDRFRSRRIIWRSTRSIWHGSRTRSLPPSWPCLAPIHWSPMPP